MKRMIPLLTVLLVLSAAAAFSFSEAKGCGSGKCKDCHTLTPAQASAALSAIGNVNVKATEMSDIPGLWSVVVERPDGANMVVYLDFSLKYLVQGEAVRIATKENVTRNLVIESNRVDAASIPLEDALVVGDPKAPNKIVIFDDPECPFCQKLQKELKPVVEKRPDIAFFIKMFPLKMHPTAPDKAKTIVCEKSLELLEKSLAGEALPPPKCETDILEKNAALAEKLHIGSTPTLVYPDGRVHPGYKPAEKIIELMDQDRTVKKVH